MGLALADSGSPASGDDSEAASPDLMPCLAEVARRYGRPKTVEALLAGLPASPHDSVTPFLLLQAAERAGFRAAVVERRFDGITAQTLPAILPLSARNAVLLLGIDGQQARIWRPPHDDAQTGAEETIALDRLADAYLGYVVLLQPRPSAAETGEAAQAVGKPSRDWFWQPLKDNWWSYGQVLMAAVMVNLFALASPLFIMNVYDRVLPNNALETGWVLGIGALTVFAFDFLIRSLRTYFIETAGRRADVQIASRVFDQVLDIRLANRPPSAGAFANMLRDFDSVRDFFTSATLTTLVDAPFALLFVMVIALLGGPVAWVIVIAMVAVLVVGILLQPFVIKLARQSVQAQERRHGVLVESVNGLETFKSLGAQGRLRQAYQDLTGKIARYGQRGRFIGSLGLHFAQFATQVSTVLVVLTGMYLIRDGALTIGGLIACVILTGRAMAPMAQIAQLINRYHYAATALGNLDQMMALPVDRPPDRDFLHRPDLRGSITCSAVTFAYAGAARTEPVLKDISTHIAAGEKVAVLGRVGSGKSTLLRLLMGLYDPDSGSVRIDDTELRQIDPADLRRAMAFAGQDAVLVRGTLRENLTLSRPEADDETVLAASKAALVHQFASRHPMGYDLPVGEGGAGLSGGQRQAVALARALIADAPVLFCDEPTNAMDNTAESAVVENLRPIIADKTFVLVTHRRALLSLVDRILLLDQGRLVADGPRDQVLAELKAGTIRGAGF